MPSTLRALQACALAFAAAGALTQGFLLPASFSKAAPRPLQASTLEPPTTVPAGIGGEGVIRPAGSGRRWVGGWGLGLGGVVVWGAWGRGAVRAYWYCVLSIHPSIHSISYESQPTYHPLTHPSTSAPPRALHPQQADEGPVQPGLRQAADLRGGLPQVHQGVLAGACIFDVYQNKICVHLFMCVCNWV